MEKTDVTRRIEKLVIISWKSFEIKSFFFKLETCSEAALKEFVDQRDLGRWTRIITFKLTCRYFLEEAAIDFLSMNGIISAKLSASILTEHLEYSMQTNKVALLCLCFRVLIYLASSMRFNQSMNKADIKE